MDREQLKGAVALVTGAANGIGAAAATRLAGLGARVVLADVDDGPGRALAGELDGLYVHCDVSDLPDNHAAVAAAVGHFGGLDLVHLNAGVAGGCGVGDDFHLLRYRRAMGVNLDGVVFGIHAALPALRRRGGGTIVATASLAGLMPVPPEPIYGANKHAVVGLVRSLGPILAEDRIRINALCPGFADTSLVEGIRGWVDAVGAPLLTVADVVDALISVVESDEVGQCWFVQPGRPSEPFTFRNVPGPRPLGSLGS
ncbi:MAG TPA: SDR family NAD(P)-dependent oxidoreductase [Acidimicrobiales bacterium]|nr:SDR family NAD(P)-dependent oxidoreductase [Acidimicrobiales bacterium]